MTTPSIRISLSADGSLQAHFDGAGGQDRIIPLRETTTIKASETIRQLLLARQRQEVQIGEDGAPTRHQLSHMERHQIFRDAKCPFCQHEELRAALVASVEGEDRKPYSATRDARYAPRQLGGAVVVRRIPLGECSTKIAGRANSKLAAQARKAKRDDQLARLTTTEKSGKELGF